MVKAPFFERAFAPWPQPPSTPNPSQVDEVPLPRTTHTPVAHQNYATKFDYICSNFLEAANILLETGYSPHLTGNDPLAEIVLHKIIDSINSSMNV